MIYHHEASFTTCAAYPADRLIGTGASVPWVKAARGVKLTTHLHPKPRIRMGTAIFLLSHPTS